MAVIAAPAPKVRALRECHQLSFYMPYCILSLYTAYQNKHTDPPSSPSSSAQANQPQPLEGTRPPHWRQEAEEKLLLEELFHLCLPKSSSTSAATSSSSYHHPQAPAIASGPDPTSTLQEIEDLKAQRDRWIDNYQRIHSRLKAADAKVFKLQGELTQALMSARPPLSLENFLKKKIEEVKGGLMNAENNSAIKIRGKIGKGGFGIVHKAVWKGLDVAVKKINFDPEDVGTLKMAILEAAIASSISHPNVVSTIAYDVKANKGTAELSLILELCEGTLLSEVYPGCCLGSSGQVYHFLLEIAEGMAHLHRCNVLHLDLKPENVLLKRDPTSPNGLKCKISDFGLSVVAGGMAGRVAGGRGMAGPGGAVQVGSRGTAFYKAPEVEKFGLATTASDVYSFGVMMGQMFKGTCPYKTTISQGSSRCNHGNRVYRRNPYFISSLRIHAPPAYCEIVRCCMDSDPRKRPTFSDLQVQLLNLTRQLAKLDQA